MQALVLLQVALIHRAANAVVAVAVAQTARMDRGVDARACVAAFGRAGVLVIAAEARVFRGALGRRELCRNIPWDVACAAVRKRRVGPVLDVRWGRDSDVRHGDGVHRVSVS